jgi:hypothetical protein
LGKKEGETKKLPKEPQKSLPGKMEFSNWENEIP